MLWEAIKPYWVAPDDTLVLCLLIAAVAVGKPLALLLHWKYGR